MSDARYPDPPLAPVVLDVDGVIIDLDDTLVDQRGAADAGVLAWARDLGRPGDDVEIVDRWDALSMAYYPRWQAREISFAEQRRRRARAFLDAPDLDDAEADAAFAGYLVHYEAAWRAFADAAPALRRFRAADCPIAVLTNGDADHQRQKVIRTQLIGLVDAVVASSTLAASKPDPSAFAAAADRIRADPVRCGA